MCRNDNACCTANLGKFFYTHSVCKNVTTLATHILWYRNTQETVFSHFVNCLSRESMLFIDFLSERLYFIFSEIFE